MSYRSAFILFLCVFATGCRTDPNRVLQERELRLMEDRIFQLEECVREYQAALVLSEQDNIALRRSHCSAGDSPPPSGAPLQSGPSPRTTPPSNPSTPRLPAERGTGPSPGRFGPLEPPRVEINGAEETSPGLPGRPGPDSGANAPSGERSRRLLPPAGGRVGADASRSEAASPALKDDSNVARVALAKLATGGYDAEPEKGDEGITLILRPLDEVGSLIRAAAPVAVVVMDPELPGEAARVARWDFSVDEVARSFSQSGLTEGIHLNMRWPDAPPVHPDLMLFVRYTTRDGRHLETHQTIRIEPPIAGSGVRTDETKAEKADETRIDPASKPWQDSPGRIVPHRLPAEGVARRPSEVPEVATKPERSLPAWSPNR